MLSLGTKQETPRLFGIVNADAAFESGDFIKWLDFTNQTDIMLRSDDILTFVEPNGKIIDKYLELTS